MYDVINELRDINSIIVMDFKDHNKIIDEIPMAGVTTHFLGKDLTYPLAKPFKKSESYYNNIELTGSKLKSKLQILQDYGDNEGCMGDPNLLEIPKFLVLPEYSPSIGWYDGFICHITPMKGRLFVVKLIEHAELDIKKLRAKRPFNIKMYYDNSDPQKKVFIEIWLSCSQYNPETQKFEGDDEVLTIPTEYDWNLLTHPAYLDRAYGLFYPQPEWAHKVVSKYITPYYLISRGFSLVNNGIDEQEGKSYWKKGKIRIYTNAMEAPNDYYWVGSKNFWGKRAKVIFRKSEVADLIKSLKTDTKDGN